MAQWTPKLKRGSTFRVPVAVIDQSGVPVVFTDTEFVITPRPGTPISLTPGNGKLSLVSFTWRGTWAAGSYVLGDTVKYGSDFWRALTTTTTVPGSADWEPFGQFLFLVSNTETDGYTWLKGSYRWRVVYQNGDVSNSYMKGTVEISD